MLEIHELWVTHGPLPALRGLSLQVAPGALIGLAGPNGAGKSSALRAIAGLHPATSGRILWDGQDITRLPAYQRIGIALVPEGRVLAPTLTVLETLQLGAGRTSRRQFEAACDNVLALFPPLASLQRQQAGTLSGGEAQMLAIGRALMCHPRLLLLDEPTLGLSVAMARRVFDTLPALRNSGIAILLADQDSRAVSDITDRTLHLDRGELREITTNPEMEMTS